MLETLVSVANSIKTAFYYVFYWSYKTGYFLVYSINIALQYLRAIAEYSVSFFIVLYESGTIFLQDIIQFLQQVISFTTLSFETIYTSLITIVYKISAIVYGILHFVTSANTAIFKGILGLIGGIEQIIFFLKKLIVLFGSGVWFLITLIPLLLYYLCTLFISFVNRMYQEVCDICHGGARSVKMFVRNTILFVSDVPLESAAGLLIAFSLTYITCQFYVLITSYLKQKLRLLRNWYRQQEVNIRNVAERPPQQQPVIRGRNAVQRQQQATQNEALRGRRPVRPILPIGVSSTSPVQSKREASIVNDEKCCVICQERNKCILLLPCRHLCLCFECARELRYYDDTCPMCRTNIDSTMKIYV